METDEWPNICLFIIFKEDKQLLVCVVWHYYSIELQSLVKRCTTKMVQICAYKKKKNCFERWRLLVCFVHSAVVVLVDTPFSFLATKSKRKLISNLKWLHCTARNTKDVSDRPTHKFKPHKEGEYGIFI